MDAVGIHTAEDLERMSPDERERLVNARVVTDLAALPPEFVERARTEGRRLLARRGVVTE